MNGTEDAETKPNAREGDKREASMKTTSWGKSLMDLAPPTGIEPVFAG